MILITLTVFTACATAASESEPSPLDLLAEVEPVPEYTPKQVVGIQLAALKANDTDDRGVAVAFRFASPRNKDATGPEANFALLLRQNPYATMLNSAEFELGPSRTRGQIAFVAARVASNDGSDQGYIFVLSRQRGGEHDDCWMTDGVFLVSGSDSPDGAELLDSSFQDA